MDLTTRKRLYRACDPFEPLEPNDARWVDVDHGAEGPRGPSFVDRLAIAIELADWPVHHFVAAGHGAGMSTELNRLAERLSRADGANLLAVWVDAARYLDLSNPFEPTDLLLAILEVTDSTMRVQGFDPRPPFMNRLLDFIRSSGLDTYDLRATNSVGLKELRANPELRHRLRLELSVNSSEFMDGVREVLTLSVDAARRLGRAGLVVLVDNLGRLQGMRSNAAEVSASIERLVPSGRYWLDLPVHIICTTPLQAIFLSASAGMSIQVLPMVMAVRRDGRPDEQGHRLLREIVLRRFPEDAVQALLGAEWQERLDRLVRWSGGVPRYLIHLLRGLLESGDTFPLSEFAFRRVLRAFIEPFHRVLSADDIRLLRAAPRGDLSAFAPEGSRWLVPELVAQGVLLPYLDQGFWFGVHPGVREALLSEDGKPDHP